MCASRPIIGRWSFLPAPWLWGVCAGRWADIPAWTMWLPALVALAAFCLAAWRGRRWCWLALLPGMLCAGVLRWQAQQIPLTSACASSPRPLICRVSDLRPYGDNQMRVTVGDLFIDGKSVPGKGVFELDLPLTTAFVRGDQLRLTARFFRLSRAAQPRRVRRENPHAAPGCGVPSLRSPTP